jgi:hypothetical protein
MSTATLQADPRLAIIHELLSPRYHDAELLEALSREFRREGYVRLPGLLGASAFAAIRDELLEKMAAARSRDFVMGGYETPRRMSVMGATLLLRETELVWTLYPHWELRRLVSALAGAEVHPCRHPEEFMVANFLLDRGHTHGWHLDDPAYSLILFFEAPPPEHGGVLEFIPHWLEFCGEHGLEPHQRVDAAIERARERSLVHTRAHAAGDAYLLRADRAMHRVTGLTGDDARRVVLNLSFEASETPVYGSTATALYGED